MGYPVHDQRVEYSAQSDNPDESGTHSPRLCPGFPNKKDRIGTCISQRELCWLGYTLTYEVVDIQDDPARAFEENILGVPCLVKKRLGLIRRLVGDLADTSRVLKILGLE